jgi:hypothetical protein
VVINTVDLMERWTDNHFRSTVHRLYAGICTSNVDSPPEIKWREPALSTDFVRPGAA